MRDLAVRRESIESRAAIDLINELNAELSHRYPEEGANYFRLSAAEVEPGRGAFFIARADNIPIGCGAVRLIDSATAEIKRMYVVPRHRSAGAGAALLARIEQAAVELGARRLVLETGVRQPEALGLYTKFGFAEIPAFGEYVNSPLTRCMAKAIGARR